ncbi:MAG: leucyl aminopeptidase [SAR324 cluster bacterium]|nr:leucyl aminopeptidase [SAR324 cluster bacterium]
MKISEVKSLPRLSDLDDSNLVVFYNKSDGVYLTADIAKKEPGLAKYLENFFKKITKRQEKQDKQDKQGDGKNNSLGIHDFFYVGSSGDSYQGLLAGYKKEIDNLDVLRLGAKIAKRMLKQDLTKSHIILPVGELGNKSEHFFEGLGLASYHFSHYYSDKNRAPKLKEIVLVSKGGASSAEMPMKRVLVDSVNIARDCGNIAGNDFTPSHFKKRCAQLSLAGGLKFSVLDEKDFKKLGMGCFQAVAKGSAEPAFLNIMEYKPTKFKETLLLVGKGLTFDTGGYSLKPAGSMEEMKFDMCGGATVVGVMNLIATLKPKVRVVAMVATAENMISDKAYKPGDIFTAYNKKTIEVINTDAEGRLVLADSLAYGVDKYKPTAIIDLATLTGACVVALGKGHTGLFSNSKKLTKLVQVAAKEVGEHVWPLPIDDAFQEEIKSDYADLKNVGSRWGGASTAAKFLENFVDKTPWVHLDIAGTAWDSKNVDFYPSKGATGVGVRLLCQMLKDWQW